MAANILGVVGSYRRGKTMDTAVAAVLEGAASKGAETRQVHLLEQLAVVAKDIVIATASVNIVFTETA